MKTLIYSIKLTTLAFSLLFTILGFTFILDYAFANPRIAVPILALLTCYLGAWAILQPAKKAKLKKEIKITAQKHAEQFKKAKS